MDRGTLDYSGLLDSPPDEAFDRLARLAAHLAGAPMALVSLVDREEQFIKAQVGLPEPWASQRRVRLTALFCEHVIGSAAPLAIENLAAHPLRGAYPSMEALGAMAYLGVPLLGREGAIGTLCVMDFRARTWDAADVAALEDLAAAVVGEITLRDELGQRARTEARLREANRLLTLGEELAHVGHWRADLESGHLHWSDEVFRINGVDPADGAPSIEEAIAAYHPDDREAIRHALIEAVEGSDRFEYHARLLRPSGEVRRVITRGVCERRDGVLIGITGMKLDVTDLKRAEEAAREAGALFRGLFDNATDLLFVHRVEPDGSTWLETMNPSAERALQRSAAEIAGRSVDDILPPGAAAKVWAGLAHVLATGEVFRAEEIYWERGGEFFEIIYVPLRDDSGGRITRVFASVRDVTHLRKAEAALRESEARFRLLADNTSDLIVLGHIDGRRSYISPAVTPMLGYTVEEAHGVPMREWVHPDDLAAVFATTRALTRAGATGSVVYRLRRKDGHYVWAEAAFRRVDDDRDDPTIITAIRDVTERQAQAEQLRLAKDEADKANAAKSEFLATMSHEIRTPLNSIIGFTDLLLDGPLAEGQRAQAELIRSSGQALLTIVNDILDFSKIEAGAVELERRAFAPATLVAQCLAITRATATGRPLTIAASLDPNLPDWLVGDEARLRQVLLNLLNNAVKFTQAGQVTLSVRHESADDRGERLRFAVVDTGIGIAPERQAGLFQRFSQVDGSISRAYGGTGLGLAISKRLVELMEGRIGVESGAGAGATFWFTLTLPRGRSEAQPGPARSTAEPGRRGRVLLAEDVEINQRLARAVLEAAGHRVDVVGDGAEAVAAVQRSPYDLVLMDVQMPGMDGLTATRHIRALPGPERDVPITAMTANVLPEQVQAFYAAGMTGHVGKPFNRAELYAAVAQALGDEPGPTQP